MTPLLPNFKMMQTPILPEMDELWQQTIVWKPSPEQQRQFQRLYEAVLEGNRQLNLTRITEPQEFWEKHLWDSLRGIRDLLQVDSPQRAIDIGTGAGFPGIPIAIAQPTWTVTLLDSTRKKIAFVDRLLEELEIKTATALVGRVEQVGHDPAHRQQYDLALIRAVATANVCAEYALPLLKLG
ncbi:16S rRNA (guanine(527)-N(7))-methyltransferase RsmG, partial [Leptolyngbya sp. FACHB-36]|uniref:16S rRNA (guanine(527)-N(7))-methyltransferase RsmG n=1 Tax=Leptolyngbya sp. FACHB-36 TaxID=2692808 RepID=UPI001681008E